MTADTPASKTRKAVRPRTVAQASPRLRGVQVSPEEDTHPAIRGRLIAWWRLSPRNPHLYRVLDECGEPLRDGHRSLLIAIDRTSPRVGPGRMWTRGLREALIRREARIVVRGASFWATVFPTALAIGVFVFMVTIAISGGIWPWNLGLPPAQTAAAMMVLFLVGTIPVLLGWTLLRSSFAPDRELRLEAGGWVVIDRRGGTRTHSWDSVHALTSPALPMTLRFADGDQARVRGPANPCASWLQRAVFELNKGAGRAQPRSRAKRVFTIVVTVLLGIFAFGFWVLADEFTPGRKILAIATFATMTFGWPAFFVGLVWLASRVPNEVVSKANAARHARGRPPLKSRPVRMSDIRRMLSSAPPLPRPTARPQTPPAGSGDRA